MAAVINDAIVLAAVPARLENAGVASARSVFLTPHESFVPTGVRFPAVGVRDMGSTFTEGAADTIQQKQKVQLICWVDMTTDGEAATIGDQGAVAKGLDVIRALDNYRLALPQYIHAARIVASGPTTMFRTDNNRWLVKKTVTVEYELEYTRDQR